MTDGYLYVIRLDFPLIRRYDVILVIFKGSLLSVSGKF